MPAQPHKYTSQKTRHHHPYATISTRDINAPKYYIIELKINALLH